MLRLSADGLLTGGIHDASLDEVKEAFGKFQGSDRRPKLFEKLSELIEQMAARPFVRHIIVDGSFVTSKPDPEDIDLIVAIDGAILNKPVSELLPVEYNALSSRRLKKQYQFDVFFASEGGAAYDEYIEFLSRIKGSPAGQKGLVRLQV